MGREHCGKEEAGLSVREKTIKAFAGCWRRGNAMAVPRSGGAFQRLVKQLNQDARRRDILSPRTRGWRPVAAFAPHQPLRVGFNPSAGVIEFFWWKSVKRVGARRK